MLFLENMLGHDTLWLMGLESGKKPGGSKEDDLERLPLLQGATNRNKIFLDSSGDIFYKLENKKEQEHYKIIDTFRKELEQKGVMFPTLLETRQITSDEGLYVGATRIPNSHAFDTTVHFGAYTDPDPNPSFIEFLAALDSIATTIPAQHFEEEDEEALSAVLMFVNQAYDLIKEDVENIVGQKELADLFTKSQKYIQDIPRVVQHKDANSSNWRTVKVENKIFVNMLDLETLGVARREWNVEGRFQGRLDSRVTKKGRAETLEFVEALKLEHVDVIYFAENERTRFLADAIARRFPDVEMRQDQRLNERDGGIHEGRLYIDIYGQDELASDYTRRFVNKPPP